MYLVDSPINFDMDISILREVNIKDTKEKMIDITYYDALTKRASLYEDQQGNYDYSLFSNIGVTYLYVHQSDKKRGLQTKKEYISIIFNFLIILPSLYNKTDIRELSRYDMENYQKHLEEQYPKKTTRSKKVTILKSFLDWCFEEGYLKKKISRGLSPVKIDKEEIPHRVIDPATVEAAVRYYNENPKIKSLILLLATTGMRLNEVITPKMKQLSYDPMNSQYYLTTDAKNKKKRIALIKPYVLRELREYRKRIGLRTDVDPDDDTPFYPNKFGKHYNRSYLSTMLSDHMLAAGLVTIDNKRITPHYIRHFFAQSAWHAGASLDDIAETLGHSSTKTPKENYLRTQLKKERDVSRFVDINI
ncbi:tyrosine-type recombinase/integrase (plasmid) [Paenibacillus polymyxa]|uniref:tyrosine-type recombinase/integrase n=1 Tax=Paenibacillus polymyxa TaxID=1406 RepID=UPI003B5AA698